MDHLAYSAEDEWDSIFRGHVKDFVERGGKYTDRGVSLIINRLRDTDSQANVLDLVHEILLITLGELQPLPQNDCWGERMYYAIKDRLILIRQNNFVETVQRVEQLPLTDISAQQKVFMRNVRDFANALAAQGGLVHIEKSVASSWHTGMEAILMRSLVRVTGGYFKSHRRVQAQSAVNG